MYNWTIWFFDFDVFRYIFECWKSLEVGKSGEKAKFYYIYVGTVEFVSLVW